MNEWLEVLMALVTGVVYVLSWLLYSSERWLLLVFSTAILICCLVWFGVAV